ncbi:MAG TPA: thioredoxin domain-containing protein [Acidimicrobiales bacterium]|nr:thioredoxin domain-containing protein [Acidimicrobiales bacterium]
MNGSVWVASYVVLWLLVIVLSVAVVALLRQIGVLHARLHPLGAHFGGEGPALESAAPLIEGVDYTQAGTTLLAFTSPTCEVCKVLEPSLAALRRDYDDVLVHTVDLDRARSVFDSFQIRSTPYVVAVDRTGTVKGRGVVNSLEQIEEVLEAAR